MYGLDFDTVEFLTDQHGNHLKVVVPPKMFSALTEFWIAARRAQTASIEAQHRPGQFKTSLASVAPPTPDVEPPDRTPSSKTDQQWSRLLQRLPDIPPPCLAPPPATLQPAFTPAVKPPHRTFKHRTFYAREFCAPLPDEVQSRIREGVYFIRAWREFRGLTRADVADLLGKSVDTVNWHENGYTRPTAQTLSKFADILDCSVEQLTVKPGTNTAPWLTLIAPAPAAAPEAEPTAPDDTAYPEGVLRYLREGKSPMKAWRLYRGISLADLGDQYGTKAANLKQMEEGGYLRHKTIGKLCPLLKCRPEQLLRPADLTLADDETPTSRRITEAMRAQA